jgi:hypothetical protein
MVSTLCIAGAFYACPSRERSQVRPRPASLRAAPWRDMTRPTLDEMYYYAMKVRPTRNPPSGFDTIMQLNQKLGIPNEPSE